MRNRKANKGRQVHKHAAPTKITKDTAGVSIQVSPEDEQEGPEGSFASGDDAADREDCAIVRRMLNRGNFWAWFCAKVTVSFDGLTSDQYLGACSYSDEADFRSCGYFNDMVSEAIDDLNTQIEKRDHFATCGHCAAVSSGKLPPPVRA